MLAFLQYSLPKTHFSSRFARLHRKHLHTLSSNSASHNFTNLSNLLKGRLPHSHVLQIHAHIFRFCAHQDNLIATRLIGHYPSQFALRVFHQLLKPNVFPFNAIIRVLAEEGLFSQAFFIFKRLKLGSLWPNGLTFSFLLKACIRASDARCVKQIHTHVLKTGFVDDAFVCNGLLAVYAKGLKDLVSARNLFDELPDKGMVCCWTSLMAGCAQSGQAEEVLQVFVLMVKEGLRPEDDTMVSALSACSNLEIVEIEKWVRILSEFVGDVDCKNLGLDAVNTILVYMYGKLGKIDKSMERFDEIGDCGRRSVLPWNVVINMYVQNACHVEALSVFRLMMENHDCRPNHVTMVSVLSACAQIGDLDCGIWVHEYLKSKGRKGVLALNTNLGTALIYMYSKCGSLEKAKEVFDQMVTKDVVSINAMITGLAINGEGEEAVRLFSNVPEFGLHPNAGTFLGVLCACSHSGLLDKGCQLFLDMSQRFSVRPELEHYACYIDLLARVGSVEEALEVASSMPFEPNDFVWGALLMGCLLHNKLELAQDISEKLVKVDPENSAGYVMLSNAFAVEHRWGDVSGMRWFMRNKGVRKQPGRSWININGIVHEFLAASLSHPQVESIYHTLDGLVKEMKLACP
ncbi:putative pentatricopeptide repeat-containing protein At3g08820 [Cornus florida]|uniref:putative pentatricopeptide repeat-containing protein At3g08820 n=1 Tax=Cornus florida TaxID=4283 RepID=UPI00289C8AAB|nr:putative pentatricopeptide repeat-containing protein At3g08820 [Cornus florida]XP_059652961.1 putative pentatricopeptide repeat-containing protein At3g08820 [Cornus florida]XP_059652962.1 putative pentatricopeptide repeat-containing protein At3g08820 [Cornus florida]XP_059652963.1 putative pentatricopeptide repeat-containing protein At3g08820 [Cornus florida]XP_059652964.1 putative pentatricopeptide repeat-containing protein At3g08820 [Cornus florida]XP_059652965.1 putative pentatricopeptid